MSSPVIILTAIQEGLQTATDSFTPDLTMSCLHKKKNIKKEEKTHGAVSKPPHVPNSLHDPHFPGFSLPIAPSIRLPLAISRASPHFPGFSLPVAPSLDDPATRIASPSLALSLSPRPGFASFSLLCRRRRLRLPLPASALQATPTPTSCFDFTVLGFDSDFGSRFRLQAAISTSILGFDSCLRLRFLQAATPTFDFYFGFGFRLRDPVRFLPRLRLHIPVSASTSTPHPGSKEGLKWKIRFDIALGIAEGLCYLHEGCQRRIIHRDIKASNILLTEDYQPQISDFGLAKWLPEKWIHHVVFPIEGTFGYMAPEYFMHGVVNEKTDVFAFGVLLLELLTGRRAVDSSRKSLVIWAKPFLDANDYKELADPSFGDDADPEELKRVVLVASMCIHHISTSRPTMNMVVQLLRGEVGTQEFMGKASKPRPLLFDSCEFEDYTCSKYLSDLHRHKQLALEQ